MAEYNSTQPNSAQVPIDLGTLQGVNQAELLMNEAIATNQVFEVVEMVKQGEDVLRTNHPTLESEQPELYQRLQKMFAKGQWFVFDHLRPQQAEALLQHHFEYFFDYTVEEIQDKFRGLLMLEPIWEERDKWRERFRTAMLSATAPIGQRPIQVAGTEVVPEVGQWLKDFRDFLKRRKPDALLMIEYMNSSSNVSLLSPEERTQLDSVLKTYFYLNQSSLTAEGNEVKMFVPDPATGIYKLYDQGQLTDTTVAIPEEELKRLRAENGLDEQGKPLSLAQRVRTAPELVEGVDVNDASLESEINALVMQSQSRPRYQQPSAFEETPAVVAEPVAVEPEEPIPAPQPEPVPEPTPASVEPEPFPKPEPEPYRPSPLAERVLASFKQQTKAHTLKQGEVMHLEPQPEPEPIVPLTPSTSVVQLEAQEITPEPITSIEPAATIQDQHVFSTVAQQVLRAYQLLFPTVEIEKRFLSIIATYTQGRRSRAEARVLLTKSPAEGGTQIAETRVNDILDTADYLLRQTYQNAEPTVRTTPAPAAGTAHMIKPSFTSLQQRIDAAKQAAAQMENPNALPQQPQVEDVLAPVSSQYDPTAPMTVSKPHVTLPSQLPQRQMNDRVSKTQHELPVIMGPVEELGHFTITEFRRLSSDPAQAAENIIKKIQLLEQESLLKRAQGVEAWKTSPLNQLYVRVGTRSFERTMAIEQAIQEMKHAGEEVMTPQEFHAIADLNRRIRY